MGYAGAILIFLCFVAILASLRARKQDKGQIVSQEKEQEQATSADEPLKVEFTVGIQYGDRYSYPPDMPERVETHADGDRTFYFSDTELLVPLRPRYRLTYVGWVGEEYKIINWYEIEITIFGGLFNESLFFETWNHKKDCRRFYRFDKVLRLTDLRDGREFSPDYLCECLGGSMKWPLVCKEFGINRFPSGTGS